MAEQEKKREAAEAEETLSSEPETGCEAAEAAADAEKEAAEPAKAEADPVEADAADEAEDAAASAAGPEAGESGADAQENGEEKTSRRFFKKKDKKDKKDEKIEELTDRVTRQMAEFENFRKRSEKEKSAMYGIGARDVIEKILPVVDNFERGLDSADLSDSFAEGMDKIYKQLTQALTDLGVTPIECVGKEFDPNFHNAVMHVDDEEAGENIVVEEFQKGYLYKDAVVRHSMVKVAN